MAAEVRSRLSEVTKPWYASSDEHANAVVRYLRGERVAGREYREAVISRITHLKLCLESFETIVLVSHGLFITTWLDHDVGLDDPLILVRSMDARRLGAQPRKSSGRTWRRPACDISRRLPPGKHNQTVEGIVCPSPSKKGR